MNLFVPCRSDLLLATALEFDWVCPSSVAFWLAGTRLRVRDEEYDVHQSGGGGL